MVLRKIDTTFDNSIVVHLYKITFANFLIHSDKTFAVGATHFKNMAAPHPLAVRVFVHLHKFTTQPRALLTRSRLIGE